MRSEKSEKEVAIHASERHGGGICLRGLRSSQPAGAGFAASVSEPLAAVATAGRRARPRIRAASSRNSITLCRVRSWTGCQAGLNCSVCAARPSSALACTPVRSIFSR